MEFLLINHPLDCPICDQGGECELQDVSMGYGRDFSRFHEGKRVVIDEDLGPLVATEMTRCIQCTRCVRFCAEVAGERELGATGRGENMRIGTFISHVVSHELSGNIIDLCPVGALTAKPSRFTARAWELSAHDSIAPHDSVGANVSVHVRRGQVMRVHPRENGAVNETWIADRDRFSYAGLHSEDRLLKPMRKQDGEWHEVEWLDALEQVARQIKATAPADMGWWLSPASTLEELYLAQRLARALGCNNVDHRLRQQDFRADPVMPLAPWLGLPIADLETRRAALVIGSDLRQEQPLLAHRLRKAALDGGQILCVNPLRLRLNHAATQFVTPPAAMPETLAALAKALEAGAEGAAGELIAAANPTPEQQAAAQSLREAGEQGVVLLGALSRAHSDYSLLVVLAQAIARASGAVFGELPAQANSVGACLAGALPQRAAAGEALAEPGMNLAQMLEQPRALTFLWGLDPELDLLHPAQALEALEQSGCVVACSAFRSATLEAVADILLPIGAFTETAGSFVNAGGLWQSFQGSVAPPGEARPGWKLLRVLANLLDLPGFVHENARQVREELAGQCPASLGENFLTGPVADLTRTCVAAELVRVAGVPIYALDPLVRHALPLQKMPMPRGRFALYLHSAQADALGLSADMPVTVTQGTRTAHCSVVIDDDIPMGCAWIPAAVPGSESLGDPFGPIAVARAPEGAAPGLKG